MRNILSNPWILLAIFGAGDLLMAAHTIPQTAAFALGALAVTFILAAPMDKAVFFIIASFPVGPALPIPGFETFALWRLCVAAFALRILVRDADVRKFRITGQWFKRLVLHERIAIAFFAVATLSLVTAHNPIAGIRKLLFLGNAAALYIALRWLFSRHPTIVAAAKKSLLVALSIFLSMGIVQYILIAFLSLYDFWQWWAFNVIPVLYGNALGEVLSISNTWFSYYADAPPTLRMFSLLPDSHSFGLTMLLGFLLAVGLLGASQKQQRRRLWFLCAAFALAVLLNGSRGIWLSILAPVFVALAAIVNGQDHHRPMLIAIGKTSLLAFLLLVMLFPVSSLLSSRAHGTGITPGGEALAFLRAKSIFNLNEASNRGRLGIWKAGVQSVTQRPLLGVGLGNTAVALGQDVSASRQGASAHNLYLDLAVETGVVGGLLSALFFLALYLEFCVSAFRGVVSEEQLPLTFAFGLAAAWIGAYNFFDVVLFNDRALLAFLVFLAIATNSLEKRQPFLQKIFG